MPTIPELKKDFLDTYNIAESKVSHLGAIVNIITDECYIKYTNPEQAGNCADDMVQLYEKFDKEDEHLRDIKLAFNKWF